ncbi:hypothetical protein ACTXKY_04705 [Corynebacterium variabile]|uniref:hypothetical protein n=1 Tax=Corynebacterium variabile TaxID=1727 RepID=UPI003FCFB811
MNRNNLTLTVVLLGSALLVLSACSSDSDDGDAASPRSTETTTTETAAPDVTDVDPASFEMDGRYVFTVSRDDDTATLCVMGDGSITCSGKAPEDAPDVTITPFPTQPPGAIVLDEDGLTWYMLEGVPPAPGKLEPSQRISDGGITCETDAEGSLDCTRGDNGFTIDHEDGAISLRGTVRVTAEAEAPEAEEAGESQSTKPTAVDGGHEDYSAASDEPVAAGTWCGVHDDSTSLVVDRGEIGCLSAQSLVEDYRDRRQSEGGGNSLFLPVKDDWVCTSPTAGRSQELGEEVIGGGGRADVVCETPEGARIVAPPRNY